MAAVTGALSAAVRSYPASEVRGSDKRSYPVSEVKGGDERSYPATEVRGGGREEIPHGPMPEARGTNPRSKKLWLHRRRRA